MIKYGAAKLVYQAGRVGEMSRGVLEEPVRIVSLLADSAGLRHGLSSPLSVGLFWILV